MPVHREVTAIAVGVGVEGLDARMVDPTGLGTRTSRISSRTGFAGPERASDTA
jgi:hypothetical protein